MEFVFKTDYNSKALKAMAKAVRKTTRAKHSRRSHFIGWALVLLAIVIVFISVILKQFTFNTFVTAFAGVVVMFVLVFEDGLNAFFAGKRMVKGSETATVVFKEENYISSTEVGTTEFKYSVISTIAHTGKYIIFVLDKNHAQAYDLSSIENGSKKQFISFIEDKTGKSVVKIK